MDVIGGLLERGDDIANDQNITAERFAVVMTQPLLRQRR